MYTTLLNHRSDATVSFDGAGSSDRVSDATGNDWEEVRTSSSHLQHIENEDKVNTDVVSCRFIAVKALTGAI